MQGLMFFGFAVWLVVFGLLLSGFDDHSDQMMQANLYCEMTEIYLATGGDYGWPDYKGGRENDCT